MNVIKNKTQFGILDEIVNEKKPNLNELLNRIKQAKDITIIGHLNPDGDCIGCQLGLCAALQSLGKNVHNVNNGPFDTDYAKRFEHNFAASAQHDSDLYIIVDASSVARLGCNADDINLDRTIVIDHHVSNDYFGEYNWVDDSFISASEMIFVLLYSMNIEITKGIAQDILNGVLSDNGYFQHIRSNKYLSLYISYLLIGYGADPKYSYNIMYCNNSLQTEKLLAVVLNRIESLCDGKILWSYIHKHDRDEGVDFHSGMVFREMLSVKGVKVAIFIKANEEKGEVNVSFRSTDDIDISLIAKEFGGGGHKVAAGATMKGDYYTIKNKILERVVKIFE